RRAQGRAGPDPVHRPRDRRTVADLQLLKGTGPTVEPLTICQTHPPRTSPGVDPGIDVAQWWPTPRGRSPYFSTFRLPGRFDCAQEQEGTPHQDHFAPWCFRTPPGTHTGLLRTRGTPRWRLHRDGPGGDPGRCADLPQRTGD